MTLGYTSKGSGTDTGDSGYMNGSRFLMGSRAGTVSSISVYVAGPIGGSGHNQYQLAIYTDNSGVPGTLIATTGTGTLQANAWNTLPLTATLSANTYYWFFYNTNGASSSVNNMTYSPGVSGQTVYSAPTPFGTWPSNFGGVTADAWKFSIYVTYTPH